eukprot:scaffold936_cov106-Amphora_coffeaeformis.AAC.2
MAILGKRSPTSPPQQQQTQTSSSVALESPPSPKRVRFDQSADNHDAVVSSVRASSPLAQVISKVHLRAEQRRKRHQHRPARRSRSPPRFTLLTNTESTTAGHKAEEDEDDDDDSHGFTTAVVSDNNDNNTNGDNHNLSLQERQLQRLEDTIREAAFRELQLMNKAKQLREKRAKMTAKYHAMVAQLRQQTGRHNVVPTTKLPPLMMPSASSSSSSTTAARRVSLDDEQQRQRRR